MNLELSLSEENVKLLVNLVVLLSVLVDGGLKILNLSLYG